MRPSIFKSLLNTEALLAKKDWVLLQRSEVETDPSLGQKGQGPEVAKCGGEMEDQDMRPLLATMQRNVLSA